MGGHLAAKHQMSVDEYRRASWLSCEANDGCRVLPQLRRLRLIQVKTESHRLPIMHYKG
jgi:hypothetical protein